MTMTSRFPAGLMIPVLMFLVITKMELIQQLRSVIRPENEDFAKVNCLLLNSVRGPGGRREEDVVSAGDALLGTVGIFEGPLGARCLGVVLNNSTLQIYQPSRYGLSLKIYSLVLKPHYFVSKSLGDRNM